MSLKTAIELTKGNRYEEALQYFQEAYKTEAKNFSEWDWFFYSKTLGKVNNFEDAIKINKFLFKKYPNLDANLNLYSWHLHKHVIKSAIRSNNNEDQLFLAAKFIIKNTKQEKYSSYERTVFDVLKHLKNKPNTNYNQILYWTEQLDPNKLSQQTYSITDSTGKVRELASYLELWYQYRVKALYEVKQFEECISLSNKALFTIKTFHYNNDIWIRIKSAASTGALGQVDNAIESLTELGREKQHWMIYQELFYLYEQKQDFDKALEMGAFSLLDKSGELKHKIKLMMNMGNVLEKLKKPKEALLHYQFVANIRSENQWSVNEHINNRIVFLEKNEKTSKHVKNELTNFWKKIKFKALPKSNGIVKKIFPNGKAGFIESDLGEDLFFQIKNVKQRKIEVNSLVNFYIIDSYDHKKRQKSKEAIEIVME